MSRYFPKDTLEFEAKVHKFKVRLYSRTQDGEPRKIWFQIEGPDGKLHIGDEFLKAAPALEETLGRLDEMITLYENPPAPCEVSA